jgi:hypothetical protein
MGNWLQELAKVSLAKGSRESQVRSMLAARRRMVDQHMVPAAGEALRPGGLVGRSPEAKQLVQNAELMSEFGSGHKSRLGNRARLGAEPILAHQAAGTFTNSPLDETGFLGVVSYPKDVPNVSMARNIRRHEVMHGYNEAARQGMEGMPLWSRVTGSMPSAVRRPLDELVAQSAGGDKFMDINWDWYAKLYADQGQQDAARVARAMQAAQLARRAAEFAGEHPVLLGAGVGGGYLMKKALAEED